MDSSKAPKRTDDAEWVDLCAADLPPGIHRISHQRGSVFARNDDEYWRVFDAVCPHHGANLSSAAIRCGMVECSFHGWRFDLTDGRCVRFGTQGLRELEVRIVKQRVVVRW